MGAHVGNLSKSGCVALLTLGIVAKEVWARVESEKNPKEEVSATCAVLKQQQGCVCELTGKQSMAGCSENTDALDVVPSLHPRGAM